MELVYLIVGGVVGGVLGWLITRSGSAQGIQENRSLREQLDQLKQEILGERKKVLDLSANLAATESDYRNLEEKLSERKNDLAELQEKFTAHFKNLANDIFEDKSKRFTDQNKTNIFDLLQPLGERIAAFEKRVDDTHRDSISRNSALREQLENLQKLNLQMTTEAGNLTRALKGDTQTQGAWGEFILESILEKSGLEKDREYTIQESFTTSEGRRRPDVVIRLPDNRHVIIDSKVSLTAYSNFVNTTSEDERAIALKAHVLSVRQHMKGLAEKNYQNISDNSLEFIIMFIPIEPAYLLAIQSERNLYEEALEKRIVFVSPTLLIPSLQLIKNGWKQEYQNRNVIEIANKAGDLYDKFAGFADELLGMGKHLDSSKKMYEAAMNKLSYGSGNLVKKVEDLKKLGVKATKTIDPRLIARSEEQQELFD